MVEEGSGGILEDVLDTRPALPSDGLDDRGGNEAALVDDPSDAAAVDEGPRDGLLPNWTHELPQKDAPPSATAQINSPTQITIPFLNAALYLAMLHSIHAQNYLVKLCLRRSISRPR